MESRFSHNGVRLNDIQDIRPLPRIHNVSQPSTLQPASSTSSGLDKVFCFQASRSRMIAGFLWLLLLGVGSGISVSAGFGPLGFSVLLHGLNETFGAPLWLSQLLLTVLFYLIAWKWAKIALGMGTLPTLLLIGPAISLGATLMPITLPMAGHALAFASGLTLFALGISLSAAASLEPDGVTALSLAAEKRHALSIPKANFLWNSLSTTLNRIYMTSHLTASIW